jgi:hypothetical protein
MQAHFVHILSMGYLKIQQTNKHTHIHYTTCDTMFSLTVHMTSIYKY